MVDVQVRNHRVEVQRITGLKVVCFVTDVQRQFTLNNDAVFGADVLESFGVGAVVSRVMLVGDEIAANR